MREDRSLADRYRSWKDRLSQGRIAMIATERSSIRAVKSWRPFLWAGIAVLLLCPLVAMQFTREVAWDSADFLAAAIVLVCVGVVIELAFRLTHRPALRGIVIAGVIVCATLIWADGAVGIL
jgi:hypothetical protein